MSTAVITDKAPVLGGDDDGWIEVKVPKRQQQKKQLAPQRSADGTARRGDRAARRPAPATDGEKPARREGGEGRREGGERRRREGGASRSGRREGGRKAAKGSAASEEEVVVAEEQPAVEQEATPEVVPEPAAAPVRIPLRNVLPGGRSWAKVVGANETSNISEPELVALVSTAPKVEARRPVELKPKVEAKQLDAKPVETKQPQAKPEAVAVPEKAVPVAVSTSAPTNTRTWAKLLTSPAVSSKIETPEKEATESVEPKNCGKEEKVVDAPVHEQPEAVPTKETVAEAEEPVTPATTAPEPIAPESTPVVEPAASDKAATPMLPPEMQPVQPELMPQMMPHPMMAPMPMDAYAYSPQEASVTMPPYAYMDISVQARIFEEDYYKMNPRQRCRGWKPHLTYFYPNAYALSPYLIRWHESQGQQLPPEEEQELQRVLTQPVFVFMPPYFPPHGTLLPQPQGAPGTPGNQPGRRPRQQAVPPMTRPMPPRGYYAAPPAPQYMAPHPLQQQQPRPAPQHFPM